MTLYPTSYLQLPPIFYQRTQANPITNPHCVKFNKKLAASLGLQHQLSTQDINFYAGNYHSSLPTIALAYAGHQFGHYVPLLGDGRALILGEIHHQDKCWDIQLKGSGRTKYSRMGDGRAPLSAVLREYLVSEAMHGLGISTTRCLAAIGCDDKLYRQDEWVAQGVLTRISLSHLRVGTFEFAAANQCIKPLADYAISRLYPALLAKDNPYIAFFQEVIDRQALLIAQWLSVGFIHGVMNTDNMSISGETLDYGPCAFLDEFNIRCVFSSIDHYGRYAYGNQPNIAYWNLAQLGQSLMPILANSSQQAEVIMHDALDSFSTRFRFYWYQLMHSKLGIIENNNELIDDLIVLLQQSRADFNSIFQLITEAVANPQTKQELIKSLASQTWIERWQACPKKEDAQTSMKQINPIYIARNHLVEKAINNYLDHQDRTFFDALLAVLENPYQEKPNTQHLRQLPSNAERVHHTFCGT